MGILEAWSREGIEVIDTAFQEDCCRSPRTSMPLEHKLLYRVVLFCVPGPFRVQLVLFLVMALSWHSQSAPPGYWLLAIWTSHPPEARANQTATFWRCSSVGGVLMCVKLWIWSPALSEAEHGGTRLLSSKWEVEAGRTDVQDYPLLQSHKTDLSNTKETWRMHFRS